MIGARRASWRIISSIEQKEESKGNEEHVKRIKSYREVVRLRSPSLPFWALSLPQLDGTGALSFHASFQISKGVHQVLRHRIDAVLYV